MTCLELMNIFVIVYDDVVRTCDLWSVYFFNITIYVRYLIDILRFNPLYVGTLRL
jgi:hypothetical protein